MKSNSMAVHSPGTWKLDIDLQGRAWKHPFHHRVIRYTGQTSILYALRILIQVVVVQRHTFTGINTNINFNLGLLTVDIDLKYKQRRTLPFRCSQCLRPCIDRLYRPHCVAMSSFTRPQTSKVHWKIALSLFRPVPQESAFHQNLKTCFRKRKKRENLFK